MLPLPRCAGRGAAELSLNLLDTTASIDTPERVRLTYRLAGPGPRALAWFIDLWIKAVVIAAGAAIIGLMHLTPLVVLFRGVGYGGLLVVLFLLEWFYGAFWESLLGGRTPGKLVLSLRVVRTDGSPGSIPDFVLRNLLSGVDFLPVGYAIGVLSMVLDHRLRRVGDLVAGTVVVLEDRGNVLDSLMIHPPVTEDERQSLPGRVDLSRDELRLIETFLRRRPKLSAGRAEELAELFGPKLSHRTGVTAPSWDRVLTLAYARATGKDRGEP